jgi:hypothetical protein
MKRQFSALSVFVLASVALATQSCEFTDGQNAYYNRSHYGYYPNGGYAQDNGYYNEGHYAPGDYQSDRPTINLHF